MLLIEFHFHFINDWASFWVHISALPFLLQSNFSFSLHISTWVLNIINWKMLNSICECFGVSKKCINCCFNISSFMQLVKLRIVSSFPTAKLNTHKYKSKKLLKHWNLKCYTIYKSNNPPLHQNCEDQKRGASRCMQAAPLLDMAGLLTEAGNQTHPSLSTMTGKQAKAVVWRKHVADSIM